MLRAARESATVTIYVGPAKWWFSKLMLAEVIALAVAMIRGPTLA
jgi:hypothetical protein